MALNAYPGVNSLIFRVKLKLVKDLHQYRIFWLGRLRIQRIFEARLDQLIVIQGTEERCSMVPITFFFLDLTHGLDQIEAISP